MQHCALNKNETNKTKITTQKAKKMGNLDPTKRLVVNPGVHRVQAVPVYYKALLVLVKVKSGKKILSVIDERNNLRKREKIHCHLRNEYFVTVSQFVMRIVKYL